MSSTLYEPGLVSVYPGELAERYELGPLDNWYTDPRGELVSGGIKIGYPDTDGGFENPFAHAYLGDDGKIGVKIPGGKLSSDLSKKPGDAGSNSEDLLLEIDLNELQAQAKSSGRQLLRVVSIGKMSKSEFDGLRPDVLIDSVKNPSARFLAANRDQSLAVGIVCEPNGTVRYIVRNGNTQNNIQIAFPESPRKGIRTINGLETRSKERIPDSYCDRFSVQFGGKEYVTNMQKVPDRNPSTRTKSLTVLRKTTDQPDISIGTTYHDEQTGVSVVYVDATGRSISRSNNGFRLSSKPIESRDPKSVGKYRTEVEIDLAGKFPSGSLVFFVPNNASSKDQYDRLELEVVNDISDGIEQGSIYKLTMSDAKRLKESAIPLPFVRGMRLMAAMTTAETNPLNIDRSLKEEGWLVLGVK